MEWSSCIEGTAALYLVVAGHSMDRALWVQEPQTLALAYEPHSQSYACIWGQGGGGAEDASRW